MKPIDPKKIILSFLLVLFLGLNCVVGNNPISIDGLWRFRADHYNAGMKEKWYSPMTDDSSWDYMPVPGNWDVRSEYADFAGKGWYRTSFTSPADAQGRTVLLTFEAVHIDYRVWLNGEFVGQVTGGFFPESFDITGRIIPEGSNLLTVCVDNTYRSGAYWNWGGIRRPVTVEAVSPVRLARIKVTPEADLGTGRSKITVSTNILNDREENLPLSVEFTLCYDGKELGKKTYKVSGDSTDEIVNTFALSSRETRLWHFDDPNLYECRVALYRDGGMVSNKTVKTGIRKVEIRDGKFLLNGEAVRMAGLNWVADHRFTGNTLPPELYRHDIDMMKSAGATMARLSHLPLPSDVYEYMDSVGMLVIDEIPIWGQSVLVKEDSPQAREWLEKMVANHYNHPCIVGWSVGNEYGNVGKNPESIEYTAGAVKFVKELDPTRIVLEVSNSSHRQEDDPTQFSDLACLNVYTKDWGAKADVTHSRYPQKPLYISEYGRDLIPEQVNDATENFSDILSELRDRPWIMGFSLWTYNDYRSSWSSDRPNWETFASGNRAWGIVDACRNPKRAYYNIRREYSPVRRMSVERSGQGDSFDVSITPRSPDDIPAYILQGYSVLCESLDEDGAVVYETTSRLPRIAPGDTGPELKIDAGALPCGAVRFSLVNPLGYRLADTILYNVPPSSPVIKEIFASGSTVRAVYDRVPLAEEYMIEYENGVGERQLSASTIAWYSEQNGLNPGVYKIRLVASNSYGDSYSAPVEVTVRSGTILPPVVLGTESNYSGINIAYSAEKTDYAYTLEWTSEGSAEVCTMQTKLKGACFIPDLQQGCTYKVRILRTDQENITSPWSEPYFVEVR